MSTTRACPLAHSHALLPLPSCALCLGKRATNARAQTAIAQADREPHPTAAPGAPPGPLLHWDWAHPCHIFTGTGLTAPTSAPGLGSRVPTSAPGLGSRVPTSALGLGSPLPDLRRDWACGRCWVQPSRRLVTISPRAAPISKCAPVPHLRRDWGHPATSVPGLGSPWFAREHTLGRAATSRTGSASRSHGRLARLGVVVRRVSSAAAMLSVSRRSARCGDHAR